MNKKLVGILFGIMMAHGYSYASQIYEAGVVRVTILGGVGLEGELKLNFSSNGQHCALLPTTNNEDHNKDPEIPVFFSENHLECIKNRTKPFGINVDGKSYNISSVDINGQKKILKVNAKISVGNGNNGVIGKLDLRQGVYYYAHGPHFKSYIATNIEQSALEEQLRQLKDNPTLSLLVSVQGTESDTDGIGVNIITPSTISNALDLFLAEKVESIGDGVTNNTVTKGFLDQLRMTIKENFPLVAAGACTICIIGVIIQMFISKN